MNHSATHISGRRRHERGARTRAKLIDAALPQFSRKGYDGVSVREIEIEAGVKRNLVQHHFGNKQGLWKAVVDRAFDQWREHVDIREELVRDLDADMRIYFFVRSYVRFNALHPEFHQLITRESSQDGWRLRYLVEEHVRGHVDELRILLEQELDLEPGDFFHIYYLLAAGGAMPFTMAPEVAMLFGVDVSNDALIDRHARIMVEVLVNKRLK